MRVRPLTVNRPRSDRRPFEVVQRAEPALADEHPAERRHRECVAPQDSALYTCGCGVAFQATVSTSVACPGCGAGQAW